MANSTRYRGNKGVFVGFEKGLRILLSKYVNTITKPIVEVPATTVKVKQP